MVPRGPIGTGGSFVGGRPFVHGAPFAGGGVVRGGHFGHGGAFVHGGHFVNGGHFVHGGRFGGFAVAPAHFLHPYYAFRPHLNVGFGIWSGFPFAYPYPFYYPYYSYNYVYPPLVDAPYGYTQYPTTTTTTTSSSNEVSQANTGGLSFDVTPPTAELWVDGKFVGTVGQFTPTTQPLGLAAGRHQIELRAAGYQSLQFDVDIIAGEVIPYRGALER